MQPIVNGLEADFAGQLAFVRRNAITPEGKAEMSYYQLPGHPSYVLVDPDGTWLWSGFGPTTEDILREQMEEYARR
jgi:hypothetical protein